MCYGLLRGKVSLAASTKALTASAKALSTSAEALSASAKALSASAKALSASAKALSASAEALPASAEALSRGTRSGSRRASLREIGVVPIIGALQSLHGVTVKVDVRALEGKCVRRTSDARHQLRTLWYRSAITQQLRRAANCVASLGIDQGWPWHIPARDCRTHAT